MKYRHIVSVTGMSGLYQLMSTKSNGAFVKSLEDLNNKFISSRSHQVTPLESIEIYTNGDNIYLHEVLEQLKAEDAAIEKLDYKNVKDYVALFAKAVPTYDAERVYNSDIKKILKWYSLLKKNDLLDFAEYLKEAEEMDAAANAAEMETEESEAKPIKKAKKAAAPKEATTTEASTEAPVKKAKATAKKAKMADDAAAETHAEKPAKKTSTKKAAVKKKED